MFIVYQLIGMSRYPDQDYKEGDKLSSADLKTTSCAKPFLKGVGPDLIAGGILAVTISRYVGGIYALTSLFIATIGTLWFVKNQNSSKQLELSEVRAALEQASVLGKKGKDEESFNLYEKITQMQNASSQEKGEAFMGMAFFLDLDRLPDQAKKYSQFALINKAMEMGNVEAMIVLGKGYRDGVLLVGEADVQKALSCFQRAVECDSSEAMLTLADAYHWGKLGNFEIRKDYKMAIQLYEQAYKTKNMNVGNHSIDGLSKGEYLRYLSDPNWKDIAVRYCEKDPQLKDPEVLTKIGDLYEMGLVSHDTETNTARARFWYDKAIKNGSKKAVDYRKELKEDKV